MIRYRTGDITSLDYAPCECGRTLARMKNITRRSDDMLIVRGVNVFPSQIDDALFSVAQGETPYQIVVERKGAMDSMEIVVEVTDKIFSLELQKMGMVEMSPQDRQRVMHDNALNLWGRRP